MSDTAENLLIIFIKNPRKGFVKQRIAKELGDVKALDIYHELLKRTRNLTRAGEYKKAVFYSESIDHGDIWPEAEYLKFVQQGGDMGERMLNAFKTGFREGFKKIALIGGDIIDLRKEIIDEAFDALENEEVVLGPATDGGYYLIGMHKLNEFVFRNKAWGNNTVFEESLRELKQKACRVVILEKCSDIDTPEDYFKFREVISGNKTL